MLQPEAHILLVDDDPDFVEIARSILEAGGFRVSACDDPREALTRLRAEPHDLIISDLMMQELDSGFSLIRQIRADASLAGLPVVLVTAISCEVGLSFTPQSRAELEALGADAFFDKPVDPGALLSTARRLLHDRRRG
jgi:two-component system, chemotaxis family, sensor kinase CheA